MYYTINPTPVKNLKSLYIAAAIAKALVPECPEYVPDHDYLGNC